MQFVKSNLDPIMIELNGVQYPARLTFKALAELEELTHKSFMKLFDKFGEGDFSSHEIINILYVSLKHGGVAAELDDLREMDFSTDFLQGAMSEIGNLFNRTQKVTSLIQDHNKPGTNEKK